jgi:hypothetical protein
MHEYALKCVWEKTTLSGKNNTYPRLVPATDGGDPTAEAYLKPRITTDSSHGGDAAVNAGVESHERGTNLPRAQDHARDADRLSHPACCAVEQRGTLECRAVDLPVGSGDAEAEGGHWVSYDDLGGLGGLGIEANVAQPADGELRVDVNPGARRCVRCAVGE